MKKENNLCSVSVQNYFLVLDVVFIILLICGVILFGIGITNIVISSSNPSIKWIFSDLSPSYTAITGGMIIIVSIIGIVYGRKIKKKTCNNGIGSKLLK